MNFESKDIKAENIKKIEEIFPSCITEIKDQDGNLSKAIDFEALKQILSGNLAEGIERYEFTWPGKNESILEANRPIKKTLRPCKEESKNWDRTENLYIEGDNLDALKLLQESYLGKVKMIYIDPPYNLGSDYIYNDDFSCEINEYFDNTDQLDDEGNRLFKNTEINGRFHSDWCSMIYPRLMLARNLLSDDGAIYISIDNNEQANLKKICDEIFGQENILIDMVVNKASQIATENIIRKHEYVLVYSKNISCFTLGDNFKYTISRGTIGNENQTMPIIEFPAGLRCYGLDDGVYETTRKLEDSKENIENLTKIKVENGLLKENIKLKARWRSSNDMRNFFNNDCKPTKAKINGDIIEIYFESDRFNPQIKKRVREKIDSYYLENKRGSKFLEELEINFFQNPKDVNLIKNYVKSLPKKIL